MASRFSPKIILASLALAPVAATLAPLQAQTVVKPASQDVVLSIGRGQLISVGGAMADVFVANDAVADVQIKSQRQLYVFGKSGGVTTIYASNARGDVIWSANVRVGSNIDSIDQMLALAMPDAKIAVATMGMNTVLLTGTIAAPEDAAEAQRLVEAFVGEGTNVISRLKTATPLQVNLRVRIAEVSRNFSRNIGMNLTTLDGTGGFQFGVGTGRTMTSQFNALGGPLGIGSTAARCIPPILPNGSCTGTIPGTAITRGAGTTLGGLGRFLGLDILGALDLAEQSGMSTTLAEPNLTALSGETANFLAGGEFPLVTSAALSGPTITYKPYGVSLSYTPVVLANGRISLRVAPSVSEISSVSNVGGVQTATLSKRSAETTVELGSGQSFMIAGLIQNNAISTLEKAPGLGDVPILGQLFRSSGFRRNETELVIVVTPYLVKPIEEKDVRLPTDGFQAPGELERLLGNQVHGGQSGTTRPMASTAEGAAAAPHVGADAAAAAAAVPPSAPRRDEKIANAAPGFSFK
ncbi:MAG: type II and III secretion system protein family protein [Altererythrobacter sp.]|nr:type II and III secretion system protein family protein [Altererythrobacter sp.]